MTDLFTYADLHALDATRAHIARCRIELDDERAAIIAEIRASADPYERDDLRFALDIVEQQIRTLALSLA